MSGPISALGYIVLEVSDIGRWRRFASDALGLQGLDRPAGHIDLRMDDYDWRLRLIEGPRDDLAFLGWEVRDAAALEALARRLEAAGVAVERTPPGLIADRRVADLIRFVDPEGNAQEAFFGPLQRTDRPVISPHGVRFKTGRQGLGHVVLSCADEATMAAFYRDVLGFRLSDIIDTEIGAGRPLRLSFWRCNGRHHSLALAAMTFPRRIVHLMLEVCSIDDVGRALNRCLDTGIHLSLTLGRHSNDEMLSFYAHSPSGFDIEYGWGGLEVDDSSWHVLTHDRMSAWGHRFQRPPRPREPLVAHEI